MTPVQFTESLGEELKKITEHIRLPSPLGGETKMNVFRFGIPLEKTNEDKKNKFPYILATLSNGQIDESQGEQKVVAHLLIGIYDNGMENQGKRWVLNIINDICERFLKDPVLEGTYYADGEITWVVDDEEEFPYHYGAMDLTFHLPTFRRENKFA